MSSCYFIGTNSAPPLAWLGQGHVRHLRHGPPEPRLGAGAAPGSRLQVAPPASATRAPPSWRVPRHHRHVPADVDQPSAGAVHRPPCVLLQRRPRCRHSPPLPGDVRRVHLAPAPAPADRRDRDDRRGGCGIGGDVPGRPPDYDCQQDRSAAERACRGGVNHDGRLAAHHARFGVRVGLCCCLCGCGDDDHGVRCAHGPDQLLLGSRERRLRDG